MTGQLSLLLTADRAHGAARTKVKKLLLEAGFTSGTRAVLQRPVSPGNLDAALAMLQHLHRRHKGVSIRAVYAAGWTLEPRA